MEAPSGTITFLFTDIEGSTVLWQKYPQAMKLSLARHDEILRTIIEEQSGYVFKTVGDAFCAAFPTAPDAVAAAVFAQRRLSDETWGKTGRIAVRMAAHTGVVEERDCDYYGPAVNRVARILSAGHGGQILISQATYELVRDELPAGATSADLGEHRLKDLIRPEHIYQVYREENPQDFPPLQSLDQLPNNLPAQPTALIGRKAEVREVVDLFRRDDIRLVTLTGPGGTGKTRLGLQVAAELCDSFPAGVYFVPLAPIVDPDLVPPTIAQILGVPGSSGKSMLEIITTYIDEKPLLLILDNYEQIVEAAGVVTELLARCSALKVLVTSREVLRIQGERTYPVPPLTMPVHRSNESSSERSLADLTQFEAVQLFIERAEGVKPGFVVTKENAPAIAEICYRLDGLPLAIELAVARLRILTPEAMLGRLDQRLPLLSRGSRDLPERQQTLSTAIAWSYELLEEAERTLFIRLGVFVGGFSLDAAESVCGAQTRDSTAKLDVFDGVESLVEKSLLKEQDLEGEPRFLMLETIREYAAGRLGDSDESDAIRAQHAVFFGDFALRAGAQLVRPDMTLWAKRLEIDLDNIRAALTYFDETDVSRRTEIAVNTWLFWQMRGAMDEMIPLLTSPEDSKINPELRSAAESYRSLAFSIKGMYDVSESIAKSVVESGNESGNRRMQGHGYFALGFPHYFRGNFETAADCFGRSIELLDNALDYWPAVNSLRCRGLSLGQSGRYEEGISDLQSCITLFRSNGDILSLGYSLRNLGLIRLKMGSYEDVFSLCREALSIAAGNRDRWSIVRAMERIGIATILGREDFIRGAVILGSTETIRDDLGSPLPPGEADFHQIAYSTLRKKLGGSELDELIQKGRIMTIDQAVTYAIEGSSTSD